MPDTEAMIDGGEAEALTGKLVGYRGPAYRKAYLADLLASGKRFLTAGNSRGADYCFGKVAEALAAAETSTGSASGEAEPGDAPAPGETDAGALPLKTSAPERVRGKLRLGRLADAEKVLARNAGRLSALEGQSFRDRLEKIRQTGSEAANPNQADRADAALLDLRRRLYQRVLRSQKISLVRRRTPVDLASLALPPSRSGTRSPEPRAAVPAVRAGKVTVATGAPAVVGPYNDRYNMEDLLGLIAEADAAWVQEFLDLYRGLADLKNLIPNLPAVARK